MWKVYPTPVYLVGHFVLYTEVRGQSILHVYIYCHILLYMLECAHRELRIY